MGAFVDDVRAQGRMLRALVAVYRGDLRPRLAEAAALMASSDRPVVVVGMGSSLSAGRILQPLLSAHGRVALVEDAGELLHYGLGAAGAAGVVIAVSQSGRSIETVRVVERIRSRGDVPVIGLVNDPSSPLADAADIALPLLAGTEASVATKTYVAAMGVLFALAEAAGLAGLPLEALLPVSRAMDEQAADLVMPARVAAHLGRCRALLLVGRGPALGVAQYAALTIKESAAMPAEALSGGAFRHGPVELTDTDIGVIVVAPAGSTVELGVSLAREVAALGRPTWLLTDPEHAQPPAEPRLLSTKVPVVPEALSPLSCVVPLQSLAAELARAAGREAGVMLVATKVTERE